VSGTPLSTDLSAVPVRKITTARRHSIFHPPPQGQQHSISDAYNKKIITHKLNIKVKFC
jgi:hypothetical protein